MNKKPTRESVLALRQKAVAFLQNPVRIKTTGILDIGGGRRCCLGHICYALRNDLNLQRERTPAGYYSYNKDLDVLPDAVLEALGFHTPDGQTQDISHIAFGYTTLISVNDQTIATPQEIGAYLETVIKGGLHTPWQSLTHYPHPGDFS